MVEPRRITWQPRFAESYQTRSVSRRVFCQRDCLVNTACEIEKNRTALDDRSCDRIWHKSVQIASEPRLALSPQNSATYLSLGSNTVRSRPRALAMQRRIECSRVRKGGDTARERKKLKWPEAETQFRR